VHGVEVVAYGLRSESLLESAGLLRAVGLFRGVVLVRGDGPQLGGDVPLEVPWRGLVELLTLEERVDVVAQVRLDGQPVGLLAPADLEATAELLAGLFHGHTLG
jgi:hypothetical protein